MPHFTHFQDRLLISTNMKVMYTSLVKTPRIFPGPRDLTWMRRLYPPRPWRHILIARSPYARLVSFHTNKLATIDPETVEEFGWQDCQKLFFDAVGLESDDSDDLKMERLRAITFEAFMGFLPERYLLDLHLRPQIHAVQIRRGPLRLNLRVDHLHKMEAGDAYLREMLGLQLPEPQNTSERRSIGDPFSAESYAIANRLYKEDFERLNYAMVGEPD
jgi:hypothetical protein